jgi:hypothetical protein
MKKMKKMNKMNKMNKTVPTSSEACVTDQRSLLWGLRQSALDAGFCKAEI